jgi:hypothetical protein
MVKNHGIRGHVGIKARTTGLAAFGLVSFLLIVTLASGYTDSSNGFSIDPPAGWTTDTSHSNGEIVSFKAPDGVSLISVIADNNNTSSIDTFIASAQSDLAAQSQVPFQLVSDTQATVAGQPGRVLIYSAEMMGVPLRVKMDFFSVNGKVFAFFLTSFGTNYDQYQPQFDASVNTIRFSALPDATPSPANVVSTPTSPPSGQLTLSPSPIKPAPLGTSTAGAPSATSTVPPTRAPLEPGIAIFGMVTIGAAMTVLRR